MPKVTSVEAQKNNPRRFNIFLDGTFAFGADEDLVVNRRLIVGKDISSAELPKLLFEAEAGKLMESMYALFSRRQRAEKEVRDYFRRKNRERKVKGQEPISDLMIEEVIAALKRKGLVDDVLFARSWVEARRRSKRKGRIALKIELFRKGISREIVDKTLQEAGGEEDEKILARQALEKKLRVWSALPYPEKKGKALHFLLRRGFEYSVASDTVDKLIKKEYTNS